MARLFTLVELMIVVAIMMVLAAIAIPNFYQMQIRARATELPLNFTGIQDAVAAYLHSFDRYPAGPGGNLPLHPTPTANLGKTATAWQPAPADWAMLGWSPDGAVRCSYETDETLIPYDYYIGGYCDVDDDNNDLLQWALYGFPTEQTIDVTLNCTGSDPCY